jgi:hypothetical protein
VEYIYLHRGVHCIHLHHGASEGDRGRCIQLLIGLPVVEISAGRDGIARDTQDARATVRGVVTANRYTIVTTPRKPRDRYRELIEYRCHDARQTTTSREHACTRLIIIEALHVIIPPVTKCRVGILVSACPSVRPSVRASVRASVPLSFPANNCLTIRAIRMKLCTNMYHHGTMCHEEDSCSYLKGQGQRSRSKVEISVSGQ